MQKEKNTIAAQCEQQKSTTKFCQSLYHRSRDAFAQLLEKCGHLEALVSTLTAEILSHKKVTEELQRALNDRDIELAASKEKNKIVEAEKEELAQNLKVRDREIVDLKAKVLAEAEFQRMAASTSELKSENEGLKLKLHPTQEEVVEHNSKLKSEQDEVSRLNSGVESKQKEVEGLKSKVISKEDEGSKLNSELKSESAEVEGLKLEHDEVAQLNRVLSDLVVSSGGLEASKHATPPTGSRSTRADRPQQEGPQRVQPAACSSPVPGAWPLSPAASPQQVGLNGSRFATPSVSVEASTTGAPARRQQQGGVVESQFATAAHNARTTDGGGRSQTQTPMINPITGIAIMDHTKVKHGGKHGRRGG